MVYQATELPPPQSDQSPDNPPGNAPRIKLRDGRYLAYREQGVPKNQSKYNVIIVHGFGSSKEMNFWHLKYIYNFLL
jgi:pimeloyl-ACP methyl ester carboxylesterase